MTRLQLWLITLTRDGMTQRGMSQRDLARVLGISEKHVSELLNGKSQGTLDLWSLVLVSLGVAQFLAKDFFGRKVVRWAIIVPWAASLVITAKLFTMIYDYYYGTLNLILTTLHITSGPIDFLGDDRWTMASMILVGIFVSVPFTAYVFVAGLNAIPTDVYEASKIDGAGPWQTYWRITLPLLRPAMIVASVLNIIYVFNSFPIVYTLNDRNPGFLHDTTITFMYKLAFKSAEKDVGMSAAAGIFNVLLILIVIVIYLRTLKWQEQED